MTSPKAKLNPYNYLHFLPGLALFIFFLFDFYFLDANRKIEYYRTVSHSPTFIFYVSETLINISAPIYTVFSIIQLRKHKKRIGDNFSYTEKIDLDWLRNILYVLTITSVFAIGLYFISDLYRIIPVWFGDNILFIVIIICVFYLGYYSIKQTSIYSLEPELDKLSHKRETSIVAPKYEKSGLSDVDSKKIFNDLLNIMKEKELYLEPELKLTNVAEEMNVPGHHISQVISKHTSSNFYHFINEYRVNSVIEQLKDDQHKEYTLLSIAFGSGFNSKTSFNTAFKKISGLTPSQFIKKME